MLVSLPLLDSHSIRIKYYDYFSLVLEIEQVSYFITDSLQSTITIQWQNTEDNSRYKIDYSVEGESPFKLIDFFVERNLNRHLNLMSSTIVAHKFTDNLQSLKQMYPALVELQSLKKKAIEYKVPIFFIPRTENYIRVQIGYPGKRYLLRLLTKDLELMFTWQKMANCTLQTHLARTVVTLGKTATFSLPLLLA